MLFDSDGFFLLTYDLELKRRGRFWWLIAKIIKHINTKIPLCPTLSEALEIVQMRPFVIIFICVPEIKLTFNKNESYSIMRGELRAAT